MDRKTNIVTRKWRAVYWGLFLITLLVSGLTCWWLVTRIDSEMRYSLLQEARMIAQELNDAENLELSGTPVDLENPLYHRVKEYLITLRAADPLCRFIYLMGRRADGTVIFEVDSERPGSKDYSPPGQVYSEGSEGLRGLFDTGIAFVEGPLTDEWGTWVSALVPIVDPRTGKVMCVLGMDINAKTWRLKLFAGIVPLIALTTAFTVILLTGLALIDWRTGRGDGAPGWTLYIEPGMIIAAGLCLTLLVAREVWLDEAYRIRQNFSQMGEISSQITAESIRPLNIMESEGSLDVTKSPLFKEYRKFVADLFKRLSIDRSVGIEIFLLDNKFAPVSLGTSWDGTKPFHCTEILVARPALVSARVFQVRVYASREFLRQHRTYAVWLIFLIGGLLTAVFSAVAVFIIRWQRALEFKVMERTLDLEKSNKRYEELSYSR